VTGPTHTLTTRLPKPLVVALTQLASELGRTRSECLASLLAERLAGYVPKYDVYGLTPPTQTNQLTHPTHPR